MNGASTANGAIVMSSASATRPRACSTEVLKNSEPASATATKASPRLPAAVSSMRWDRPVAPAPEALVIRCTVRVAPLAAAPPTRAADCEAETTDRLARLARAARPESPMVFSILPCQVGDDQAAPAKWPRVLARVPQCLRSGRSPAVRVHAPPSLRFNY